MLCVFQMVQFEQQTLSSNLRILFVKMHGITDIFYPTRVVVYAFVLVMPMPGVLVTLWFFAASLVHFAVDMGAVWSLILHCLLASMYCADQQLLATETMLWYMSAVHVPLHYWNLVQENTTRSYAAVIFGVGLTLLMAFCHPMRRPFNKDRGNKIRKTLRLSHLHQRLVVAHVACMHMPRLFGEIR